MKAGRLQKRLLKEIAVDPRYSTYLHNAHVYRTAESLIQKGLLDNKWQITANGKQYLERDQAMER